MVSSQVAAPSDMSPFGNLSIGIREGERVPRVRRSTIFLEVGEACKAVGKGIAEGFEPPGGGEGKRHVPVGGMFIFKIVGCAHQSAQFVNVVWHKIIMIE